MNKNFTARDNFGAKKGQSVFLVFVVPSDGRSFYEVRENCPVKNISRDECESGWLGCTNGTNYYAHGRGIVTGYSDSRLNGQNVVRVKKTC